DSGATQHDVLWPTERDSSVSNTAYELAPHDRHSSESISSSFMFRDSMDGSIEHAGHFRLRNMDAAGSSFSADHSRDRTDHVYDRESDTPVHTGGASMISSFFNLTNAIVGAGVIGLPYAIRQAGFIIGVLMIIVLALLVDWTLRVLALNSKLSGQQTYQGLVEHCFGRTGLLANSFFQGAMAGGGMASFIVIVGDTLPH
ncbi:hypothetical protein GGH20_005154, partial [Coemansia sp. RSA 1937]